MLICLLPNCGYLSETSRMLEIHRALVGRGVQVKVATHGGVHERLLHAAGVDYDVVGARMSARRSTAFVASAMGQGSTRQSMYTDDELRSYARAEADYFKANGVTVAVTGFTLTALLSSRLAGIPLVTEHAGSWVPPVFERDLLPVPSSLPGMPRALSQLVPGALLRRLSAGALPRLRYYCAGFDRVAAELGVEPVPSTPALVLGDLTLVPEVPEVIGISAEEMAAWRPRGGDRPTRRHGGYRAGTRFRYSGPLYARLDLPLPERVARFLRRPDPVVYVALTSTPAAMVRRVVRALSGTDVRMLVAATVHDLDDLASDRVMVESVLPSHLIMPQVDLAVVTGGQGSVQTAMASGTPLVGIPLHIEQDLNVALVERLGAARAIQPRKLGPNLAALVHAMLADPEYRNAAQRIQQLYAGIDGPGFAAEAIMDVAERSVAVGGGS